MCGRAVQGRPHCQKMNRQLAKELWDIRKSSQCEANRHGEKSRGRNLWLWVDSRNDAGRQRNCVQTEPRKLPVCIASGRTDRLQKNHKDCSAPIRGDNSDLNDSQGTYHSLERPAGGLQVSSNMNR